MWLTLIITMRISMRSRKLLWPTIIGLSSVVVGSLRLLTHKDLGLTKTTIIFMVFNVTCIRVSLTLF